jgi:hypothetical protein
MDAAGNLGDSGSTHYNKSGLHLMVVRLPADALACRLRVLARLVVSGRSTVIRLCLRSVRIDLGRGRLIEMVRVNFLLSVGLQQERGPSTNCEY